MEAAGGGAIVSLTFQASQRVFPNYNVMGSAKAALEHATRQLAYELGPMNIRVNTISAGPVATLLSAREYLGLLADGEPPPRGRPSEAQHRAA
jgi:enoyl-[acyl-carrier protein] reductase I